MQTLEERVRRKRLRNRLLILLSPVLILLAPILVPVYFLWFRKGAARKSTRIRQMGEVAGTLGSVKPEKLDPTEEARLDALADTFALCRVIGNDLVPRHTAGQSLRNVAFILENEPQFANCTKLWVLNRIFDPENERRLIALLEEHGQIYERIPYDASTFQAIGYDFSTFDDPMVFADGTLGGEEDDTKARMVAQAYRLKNNYVMNNNGARNAALELCIRHAKWALPFDGNCFFTQSAWDELTSDILSQRDKRYFQVPMARMHDNADLLVDQERPETVEEPQLAFRCDAPLRFDEAHPYGRRPKVELFLHLGIPGPWRQWPLLPFDLPPRKVSPEGYRVGSAGWVARLFSGKAQLEVTGQEGVVVRGSARNDAIRATLNMLEEQEMTWQSASGEPLLYSADRIAELADMPDHPDHLAIRSTADEALQRGPFSVTDKPEPGPSGDLHDYFHPAPYWWPNPKKKDGLPYVRQDGRRVPGTQLYEADSDRYDRTRLQRVFDDTTFLALAARLSGDQRYSDHAENLVRTWFIDPDTKMNPHLYYAQVRRGHAQNRGLCHGLIETKDFYYFFDAIRMLDNPTLNDGVKEWSREFFDWFQTSDQGIEESRAANNHGTCFDLQAAALAAFLGDVEALQEINLRAQARLLGTITLDGAQPHEMKRTLTQHYCTFNLQSWVNLFDLLEGTGLKPWSSSAAERLLCAIRLVLTESSQGWSHPQIEPFEAARLVPLDYALQNRGGESILQTDEAPACFFPHDGIPPFWRLTRGLART